MGEQMTAAEFKKAFAEGRRAAGKRARDNGDGSEKMILDLCDQYALDKRARLRKVDPPSKVVGPKRRIIYQANPFLDLVGTWTEKGGRALFLEVKSTESPRLPISRGNGVTEKQIESLKNWRDAGAVTGVLWIHRGEIKVVPTIEVEFAQACGHASVGWDEFPECKRGTNAFLRFDFLAELDRLGDEIED